MIVVDACGLTNYSQVKKSYICNNAKPQFWGDHAFLEAKKLGSDEIAEAQIQIKIINQGLFRDAIVGKFNIDVSKIYKTGGGRHALENQWIGLLNSESSDPNEIKAYLKVSISVQGPGDNSIKLEEGDCDDSNVMTPPSLKQEQKQINLTVISIDGLPVCDDNILSSSDVNVYFKTQWKGLTLKTTSKSRKKNSKEPVVIQQTLRFGVKWPMAYDKLTIEVFDKNLLSDELLGTVVLKLKNIVNNYSGDGGFCRMELYGAPLGTSNNNAGKIMNSTPDKACMWHGSILFHFQVTDTEFPDFG